MYRAVADALPYVRRGLDQRQRIINMLKSARSRAEAQFAATQKKGKPALNEKEKEQQGRAENTAKLRALRLAKEVADLAGMTGKKGPDGVGAEKVADQNKKMSRWPQAQLSG